MEYMLAMGRAAKKHSLLKVMHSNGFVNPKPLADLCEVLDAACIDLKGFTENYYREMTEGQSSTGSRYLKDPVRPRNSHGDRQSDRDGQK